MRCHRVHVGEGINPRPVRAKPYAHLVQGFRPALVGEFCLDADAYWMVEQGDVVRVVDTGEDGVFTGGADGLGRRPVARLCTDAEVNALLVLDALDQWNTWGVNLCRGTTEGNVEVNVSHLESYGQFVRREKGIGCCVTYTF